MDRQSKDFAASLIIPYYQRAGTISRALESAERSVHINEIIIVDDELSSNSRMLLDNVCQHSDRVRIIQNVSQKGALAARVTGALAANNDLLVFLDSDDEVLPHGIAQCLQALFIHPDLVLAYGNICWGDSMLNVSNFLRLNGFGYLHVLKNLSLCPFSGLCVRKSLIAWEGLCRDLPAWQDDEFVLTASRSGKIWFIDCVTAVMHDSGTGRISANKHSQLAGLRILLEKWGDEIQKNYGIFYLYLWKLRAVSITLKIFTANLEKKKTLSGNTLEVVVLKFALFTTSCLQGLLRRIFRVFYDRVYA
jgi:glycosyltransferase involved in cell wall biosynthesis